MEMEGLVGPQRCPDGNSPQTIRLGNQGEIITGEMSGKYFEQTLRGNTFLYGVASQALLLSATTGGHPTVWNPSGSGVLFVPLSLTIGFISGTTVIGSVNIADTVQAGSGISATAAIKTATLVAPVSALRGSGKTSQMLFSPTTNTFLVAPVVNYSTGLNLGAAAPTGTGTYEHLFNGRLAFPPGTAMSVVYSVTTSTALFSVTICGLELPLPGTA